MNQYLCAIHIHTLYSDGTGKVEDVLGAARRAGVNIVMITDHHTLGAMRHGYAGWHDGILIIVGYEHSDVRDENHLLVFGLTKRLSPALEAREYVNEVRRLGGFSFVAHPIEKRRTTPKLKAYPWTASPELPFDGMEIWNYLSLWTERLSPSRAPLHYIFPGRNVEFPDKDTLKLWDELSHHRIVAGIAGMDAHALKVRWGPLRGTVFPYVHHMRSLLTCVQTELPLSGVADQSDTKIVLQNLAMGRSYFGNQIQGPLGDLRARINGMETFVWGESHCIDDTLELSLESSLAAEATLLSSGSRVAAASGIRFSFLINQPGVYRIVLSRKGKPWILTNHFRVRRRHESDRR